MVEGWANTNRRKTAIFLHINHDDVGLCQCRQHWTLHPTNARNGQRREGWRLGERLAGEPVCLNCTRTSPKYYLFTNSRICNGGFIEAG